MKARAKELGINMSFHAAKAIQKEIGNQEKLNL
jgi:post-segregation antitoxin (ccd killing protein)